MSERLTCGECHAERDELTGLLCYRCRSRWQEKEMNELRAEIERLKAERDEARAAARWLVSNVNYEEHYEAIAVWRWLGKETSDE
uniref:Uncharacterized protein n=1 Tax=viral metagenome TaxID=1070528 RepID=A0A6M3JFA9_9ZZZZ